MSSTFQYFNPTFNNGNADVTSITQAIQSNVLTSLIYETNGMDSFVLTGVVSATSQPSASTYASASKVTSSGGSILFTKTTATGYAFGLVVRFTTSTTLPTGVSASTDYYVVPQSTTTFKLATSYANALAGTYIAYTDTGTGTQTATPTALAGCSMYLQGSNDYETASSATWATVPYSTTTITADANIVLSFPNVEYKSYRVYAAITTGQISFTGLQIGYRS